MDFNRFATTRKKIMAISIICSVIIIAGGTLALTFLEWWLGTILSVAAIVLLALFSIFCLSPMMRTYKRIVIEETLKSYLSEIEFDTSRFNKEFIKSHPLFELKKQFKSDYYFLGTYKEINFEIGNVQSYDELKDHHVYISSYSFNGKIFSLPVETDEKAEILIIEKKDRLASEANRLKNTAFQYLIKSKNEPFNEMFELFSTVENIEITSFISLSIELIRKIKKICAHRLFLLLKDNRLYLAIDEQNSSFQLKLKNPVTTDDVNELRKEYSPFFHFMDALLEQIKKSSSS